MKGAPHGASGVTGRFWPGARWINAVGASRVATRALRLVTAVCALCAGSASAQAFTGVVVDETTGHAVPTAGVYLLAADDTPVSSTLTGPAGRYRLEIPEAGEYKLTVDRFGYEGTTTPLFAVTADREYGIELSVRPEPIRVEGVSVRVDNERVERVLTQSLGGLSPHSVKGFRSISGFRLQEAIEKSDDGVDMLRWLYLPAFNKPEEFCISAYTNQECLELRVDGQALPSELIETLDMSRVRSVLVLPPWLIILTADYDFAPLPLHPSGGFAPKGIK